MIELWLTALMVGFLGGVHCLGMCSPIAAAFTFQLPEPLNRQPWSVARYQLAYNLGRISTYTLLGALAGVVGLILIESSGLVTVQRGLMLLAGLWMFVLAAWLLGWSSWPTRLEAVMGRWWPSVSGHWRQKFFPISSFFKAYVYGLLWGGLPCGLVYSTLFLALSSGGVLTGAMVMLAFGLGTLPNLLLMGVSAFWLTRLRQQAWLIRLSALSIAVFGGWMVWQAIWGQAWQNLG